MQAALPETISDAMPATVTVALCPMCQSRRQHLLFETQDRLHRLPGRFSLVQCDECGLLILSPRPLPEGIGYYYPEASYYSYQFDLTPNPALEGRPLLRWVRDGIRQSVLARLGYPAANLGFGFRLLQPLLALFFGKRALYSVNDFPRYVPGGRALEIGCGSGVYLACLKQHGWQVAGVELSAAAAQLGQEKWGLEIHTSELSRATFPPASFDYIRLSDVIEHLYDPVETLRLVSYFLKPGGQVFLQTPNADCFGFEHWQSRWFGCDSPRHLYLFSPATLRRAVEAAGLRVARLKTLPLLPGNYVTEFSYEFEAAHPTVTRSPRFQFQPGERWQARKLALRAHWDCWRNPLRGEVIQCWVVGV